MARVVSPISIPGIINPGRCANDPAAEAGDNLASSRASRIRYMAVIIGEGATGWLGGGEYLHTALRRQGLEHPRQGITAKWASGFSTAPVAEFSGGPRYRTWSARRSQDLGQQPGKPWRPGAPMRGCCFAVEDAVRRRSFVTLCSKTVGTARRPAKAGGGTGAARRLSDKLWSRGSPRCRRRLSGAPAVGDRQIEPRRAGIGDACGPTLRWP